MMFRDSVCQRQHVKNTVRKSNTFLFLFLSFSLSLSLSYPLPLACTQLSSCDTQNVKHTFQHHFCQATTRAQLQQIATGAGSELVLGMRITNT